MADKTEKQIIDAEVEELRPDIADLKARLGGDRVLVGLPTGPSVVAARAAVAAAVDSEVHVDEERSELVVEAGAAGGTAALLAVVRALDAAAITPSHVQLREPTLDEVFLHLTNRPTTRDGGHR